jgi:hypothetical protein
MHGRILFDDDKADIAHWGIMRLRKGRGLLQLFFHFFVRKII